MVCPHGQGVGGLSQCGNFVDKEGVFFAILCGCLLWRPYEKFEIGKPSSHMIKWKANASGHMPWREAHQHTLQ